MTDQEKLLTALLSETDPGVGGELTVYDVIAMLTELGAAHQRSIHLELDLVAV